MTSRTRARLGRLFLVALASFGAGACNRPPAAPVAANDNRTPAGRLSGGVLALRLEVRNGMWRPEGARGVGLVAPMFGEEGRPLQNPGPLIRVPSGTRVALHLRNTLSASTVTIHGFHDHPGRVDRAIVLVPGAVGDLTFTPGAPGTYFYWATTTGHALDERDGYDGQLNGAFIVDPPGADPMRSDERVFVISHWSQAGDPHTSKALEDAEAWVINGQSWPETERLTYPVKRPIHWRMINASYEGHPMHLHGTYYHIESIGTDAGTHTLAPDEQPMVATNVIGSGETEELTWTPGQPGNWLFHCHILYHVDPRLHIAPAGESAIDHGDHAAGPPAEHMAGLVLGIHVEPEPGDPAIAPAHAGREVTLEIGERDGVHFPDPETPSKTWPGLGYRLIEAGHAAPAPFTAPGPTLVLTRGEPVAIAVDNHLSTATTVHWHGIELESYYDGVSGFGGLGPQLTPAILPGARFVARFTPPRSGTFMYHTHLNDFEQLSTGLYGAIVVVDPGARFDPAVDKVFVLSRGGLDDEKSPVLMNGSVQPAGEEWQVGVAYRLRFIGITPAPNVTVALREGEAIQRWRPLAKDGATFPASRPLTPASQRVSPGETYDFVYTPGVAGALRLTAVLSGTVRAEMTVHVK